MIRSILRTFSRFLMAVVLLGLIVCAVEVWFRWERVQSGKVTETSPDSIEKLVRPSSTTWLEVAPLVELSFPVSLTENTQLRTSSFGTRGNELEIPKPIGRFRVLCIGGGNMFGLGQTDEQTIPAQLQALFREANLSHVEFVNAGCPGAGPLTQYLRVRSRFLALQPDLILYCIDPGDVLLDAEVRGGLSLDNLGKPAYSTHPAKQSQTKDEFNLICQEFATADWLVNQLGSALGLKQPNLASVEPQKSEDNSLQPLLEIEQLASSQQCQLMISIIPNVWSLRPQTGAVASRNVVAFERDMHVFFADHGIQTTSLIHNPLQVFQQNQESQVVLDEATGNLNANGNVLYARTLAKSMVDFFPQILNIPTNHKLQGSPLLPIPAVKQDENRSGPQTNRNQSGPTLIR